MKLKLSKTALRELTKQYRAVLLGCLIAATASSDANATVQVVGDIEIAPVSVVTNVDTKSSTDVNSVVEKTMQTVYTSSEMDSELVKKANVTDLANYATTSAMNSALSAKADATALNEYVKKVEGKGLSTNDFTTAEKEKLADLENYDDTELQGKVTDLEGTVGDATGGLVKDVADVKAALDTKANAADLPTKTSDLTNDSGFITNTVNDLTNYTTTTEMNTKLAAKQDKIDAEHKLSASLVNGLATKVSELENDEGFITKDVTNLTHYTTTTAMNTALDTKADKTTTYTKSEVNTELAKKADKATTLEGYGITDAYTKDQVDAELAKKVSNADQFTTASSDLIKDKTVTGAIVNVADQTDENTAVLATLNGTGANSILQKIKDSAATATFNSSDTYETTTIGGAIQQNATDIAAVNALIGATTTEITDKGALAGKVLSTTEGDVTVAKALGLLSDAAEEARTMADNAANLSYNGGTATTFKITDKNSTVTEVEAYTKGAVDTLVDSLIEVDADKIEFYTADGNKKAVSYTADGTDAAITTAIDSRFLTTEGSGLVIDTDGEGTTVELAGLGANTFTGNQTINGDLKAGKGTFDSIESTGNITAGTGDNQITLNASNGSISAAAATITGALGAGSFSAGTNAFEVDVDGNTTVNAGFETKGLVNLSGALGIADDGKMTIAKATTVNSLMTFADTVANKPSVSIDNKGITANNGTSETFKLVAETGNMSTQGTLTVAGLTTLSATNGMTFDGSTIVKAIDDGSAAATKEGTTNASTLATLSSVLTSAENGVYTNSVTGSNIASSDDTLNKAVAALDTKIGADDDYGTEFNGVLATNTIKANIAAVNEALGDIDDLVSDTKNLTNGGTEKPKDVVTAIMNMDATLGTIHGLQAQLQEGGDETSLSYKGTNLANGTTVEDHLTALDASIGNLKAVNSSNDAIDTAATTQNIATAFQTVGNAIGDQQFGATRYISTADPDLSSALRTLDSNLGRVEDTLTALDHRTTKMHHEMKSGFASLAAMSGLVPNTRNCGDTQIAVGTGYYRGTTGFALGAFHNLTDHVLLNAGASYAGNGSAMFKGGVTFGF